MTHRVLIGAAAAMLLGALACKAPDPSVRAAAASAASFPAAERDAYQRGFLAGARMPGDAAKAGRLPEAPKLDKAVDELDSETGFVRWDLSTRKDSPEARGTVDGFAWALGAANASPRRNPTPAPLSSASFHEWAGDFSNLQAGGWTVLVDSRGGVLFWSAQFQGFAPVRGWRDLSALGAPKGLALEGDALWVAGSKGVWALDLASSALRRAESPLTIIPVAHGASGEEAEGNAVDMKTLAEKGDVAAMVVVGAFAEQEGNYPEALSWFRRAADKGEAKAMEHLAVMAALGRGGPVDKTLARVWLERADGAGDPDAKGLLLALEHPEKLQ